MLHGVRVWHVMREALLVGGREGAVFHDGNQGSTAAPGVAKDCLGVEWRAWMAHGPSLAQCWTLRRLRRD